MNDGKKKEFDLSELAINPQVLADSKKLIAISRDTDPNELLRLLIARMEVLFPSAFHKGEEVNLVDLIYLSELEHRRAHGTFENWFVETLERAKQSGLPPIAEGLRRTMEAEAEHERWKIEANAIREKHPNWSNSDVARHVIKNLGLTHGIEAVRKKI